MVTLWTGGTSLTGGRRNAEDVLPRNREDALAYGAARRRRAAGTRKAKPRFISLLNDLERNWTWSAALVLGAILIVSIL